MPFYEKACWEMHIQVVGGVLTSSKMDVGNPLGKVQIVLETLWARLTE